MRMERELKLRAENERLKRVGMFVIFNEIGTTREAAIFGGTA